MPSRGDEATPLFRSARTGETPPCLHTTSLQRGNQSINRGSPSALSFHHLPNRQLHFLGLVSGPRAPVAAMLSLPHSLKPRQPGEIWQAFHASHLPPALKDFVHKALWARLPVGQRQAAWKPLEVWCPIDHEPETLQHALYHCHLLVGAFEVIDTAFRTTGQAPFSTRQLLCDDVLGSLSAPAGIVGWLAVFTNWFVRCAKKFNSFTNVTWDYFCRKWGSTLALWKACPRYLPISHEVPTWFLEFL